MSRLLAQLTSTCVAPVRMLWSTLPDRLKGRIDFYMRNEQHFYPWRGPMNGQAHRLEIARRIIEDCGIERIVETGTYRGTTTAWFADFGLPVDTVEAHPRYHYFSGRRLANFKNVSLEFGNSVDFIDRRTRDTSISRASTLYYLDAHWRDNLPLADELRMILTRTSKSVVLVDDFQVPGDSGYAFDDYGPGKALTLDYLDQINTIEFVTFRPRAPSRFETGARRGCIVIARATDMTTTLSKLECLIPLQRFPRG